jgi:Gnt-I system high-affinity gluconate transporter
MMPLLVVIIGVILLLLLITVVKFNAFLAFVIVCIFVGVTMGLSLDETIEALKKGIGDTLSLLVLILGFGAMLGQIIADSGAAQRITQTMVSAFGLKHVHLALMLAGFIVGIPMFFSVGFVILIPLVFTLAASTGLSLLYVGIPMIASLSVTHGLLPPHPAPTALADMFDADMGRTILLGLLLSVPAILLAGPLLSPRFKHIKATPLKEFTGQAQLQEHELPSVYVSVLAALMPVILIGISGLIIPFMEVDSSLYFLISGLGNPVMAMLLSVLFAIFVLALRKGRKMADVMKNMSRSISSIAMILLIIAGAGSLKEILVVSGISEYLGEILGQSTLSPLILAWLIAAVIRISVGSATVAAMTAAGIVLPLVSDPDVSPELMVLAIGSGSLIFSHVNDAGFWLFKEYFNLSIKNTLLTWSLMETVISVVGLLGVLLMNMFI